ncbi:MAG TPA: ScyD/ScyE family protein [Gemmatimonadaceae bacterium]|jgi:hypothetical protein|nr:ScyD/ScyE family protein [Gemmatimonadaceae bacterium]
MRMAPDDDAPTRKNRSPLALVCLFGLLAATACDQSVPSAPSSRAPGLADRNERKQPSAATVSVFASGFSNPRGLRFGPDGYLYVAEGGTGGPNHTIGLCPQVPAVGPYSGGPTGSRISKVSPAGVVSTVASSLPSSSTNPETGMLTSGVADIDFIGNTLYGLLSGAGCSHGVPSIPNQVFRVNRNGTWTTVANLSAYYHAHPTLHEEEDDFEPDGTPYSMIAVRGDLYVVEPNHGSLDRVSPSGAIRRVVDISATMGHIVPTSVSHHGNFFVGNLGTFPVNPGSEQILKVTPSGKLKPWVTGLTMILGTVWDDHDRLYVLESSTVAGDPTPLTGRILRVDPSGKLTTIADGLFLPSGMTLGPDGNLYVSNVGFGPLALVTGQGQVLKVHIN